MVWCQEEPLNQGAWYQIQHRLHQCIKSHHVLSFAGRVASVVQGSTETTFYVLAVYFGAVRITRTRHAAACGLAADAAPPDERPDAAGADALLVRVGAYYHDLGKTENPQYYIENQFGVSNPHDELDAQEKRSSGSTTRS